MDRAQRQTAEIHDRLVSEMQSPPPDDWETAYTPEAAAQYRIELISLEEQLDQGWPGWRRKEPFGHLDQDKIGWIKKRLKRRDLILRGHGRYGVRLVQRGGDKPPLAVPVIPRGDLRSKPYRPLVSVPLLAIELGARPGQIQEALSVIPPTERDVSGWIRAYLDRPEGDGGGSHSSPLASRRPLEPIQEPPISSEAISAPHREVV